MGCGSSSSSVLPAAPIKLALLGGGQCGKSTLMKQLQLQNNGMDAATRSLLKGNILQNVTDSFRSILKAVDSSPGIDMPVKFEAIAAAILDPATDVFKLDPAELDELAKSPMMALVVSRPFEYSLPDSAPYFLDNYARLLGKGYEPTDEDIVRARLRTTGSQEFTFHQGSSTFTIIDRGGQICERKHWIHSLEGLVAVFYVASLADFDLKMEEDPTKSRLVDSLATFTALASLPFLRNVNFIVFLNKEDVFREKIKSIDMSVYLPDYHGGNDPDKACAFIENMYREAFEVFRDYTDRTLLMRSAVAVDKDNFKFLWAGVTYTLLDNVLRKSGMNLQ